MQTESNFWMQREGESVLSAQLVNILFGIKELKYRPVGILHNFMRKTLAFKYLHWTNAIQSMKSIFLYLNEGFMSIEPFLCIFLYDKRLHKISIFGWFMKLVEQWVSSD